MTHPAASDNSSRLDSASSTRKLPLAGSTLIFSRDLQDGAARSIAEEAELGDGRSLVHGDGGEALEGVEELLGDAAAAGGTGLPDGQEGPGQAERAVGDHQASPTVMVYQDRRGDKPMLCVRVGAPESRSWIRTRGRPGKIVECFPDGSNRHRHRSRCRAPRRPLRRRRRRRVAPLRA